MAGKHSSNKRPMYYVEGEAKFFEETPKHVLYALVREFAGLCDGDSADRSWETGAWLKLAREHIAILRDGGIIQ